MVYKVFALLNDGRTIDTGEGFRTRREAETFTGIEGTQMDAMNVQRFIIRKTE